MDVLRCLRGMVSIGDQTYMRSAHLASAEPARGHAPAGLSASISAWPCASAGDCGGSASSTPSHAVLNRI